MPRPICISGSLYRRAILAALTTFCTSGVLVVTEAAAVTINFDSFTGVDFLGGAVGPASQLSDDLVASTGAVFSTQGGADYAAIVDLDLHPPLPHAPSTPNGVGGATSAGNLTYGLPVRVSFFDPTDPVVMATTDLVSLQGDLRGNGIGLVYLEAYDVLGNLITSDSSPDAISGGSGVLTVAASGIHYVLAYSDDGSVGFDNLVFNEVAPVPEPSTAMLLGLGLAGMAVRRHKR